ncbi:hypothetical protein PO124_02715 [Bacillus licheniformis]|nr:hypothetical protein [Bacillus licheniformis]
MMSDIQEVLAGGERSYINLSAGNPMICPACQPCGSRLLPISLTMTGFFGDRPIRIELWNR